MSIATPRPGREGSILFGRVGRTNGTVVVQTSAVAVIALVLRAVPILYLDDRASSATAFALSCGRESKRRGNYSRDAGLLMTLGGERTELDGQTLGATHLYYRHAVRCTQLPQHVVDVVTHGLLGQL